jgi:murein DD-endopeptidase MepM/ murein hydrolase activator NlpD
VSLSERQREQTAETVGKMISLSTFEPVRSESATLQVNPQPVKEPEPVPVIHKVVRGETLSKIADQYGLHVASITLANSNLQDMELIKEGDGLVIPPQDASADDLAKEQKERTKKNAFVAKAAAPAAAASASTNPAPSSGTQTGGYTQPIASYTYMSQGYAAGHRGIDFAAPQGTPVLAMSSGCIITTSYGWNGGYGVMIIMEHGGGLSSLYAHLKSLAVKQGACVKTGQVIGYSGNTGRSTGAHLHFEVRKNSIQVNPLPYVR